MFRDQRGKDLAMLCSHLDHDVGFGCSIVKNGRIVTGCMLPGEVQNMANILYNYPGRTGVDMTPDLIGQLAELRNILDSPWGG